MTALRQLLVPQQDPLAQRILVMYCNDSFLVTGLGH